MFIDLEKRQDARFTDEKSKSETEILLPGGKHIFNSRYDSGLV